VTHGNTTFDGQPIGQKSRRARAKLGIGFVPDRSAVFSTLSVTDNLAVSLSAKVGGHAFELVEAWSLFTALYERRTVQAGHLSGGERQMLAIAMALMSKPRLLMIDDMSCGLASSAVETLCQGILRLRAQYGLTVLIVEENIPLAVKLADRVYVLGGGRVVYEGLMEYRIRAAVEQPAAPRTASGSEFPALASEPRWKLV
jgi:branched-chain amino acid transport system ATP-binding protein